ncbi:hypothetical protein K505DRAFT_297589 [Melanomma pulvis-pyrius CBS 109.77]|uniref:Potassium channel tetramerisation-type BTB domain-containing protein n=1 Tax=Melanomma pulvis-pyrius CBS 109.77 TaxID=1314802 RepID=A0A6A6XNC2_9PLEO|nr:hypothetical protein K505DRAFT_297589 [Melanomma pulvis-pyrius CBS 109.77]
MSTAGEDSLTPYANNEQLSTPRVQHTSIIGGPDNTPPDLSCTPSTVGPRIITLDVGGRIFRAYAITLQESDWLDANIKRWVQSNSPTNPLFLDTDPDLFEHILRYLRRPEVFPLFWTPTQGFDYDLYNRLEVEAQHFGIQALEDWIHEKKYLGAVIVHHSAPIVQGMDQSVGETLRSNVQYDHHIDKKTEQVYICPRGILVHRGRRDRCGLACAKVQGDDPMHFEEEHSLDVVTFTRTTVFDGSVCRL